MHTAKFMCISPAGYFSVFLVDESHKKFWGAGRDQTGKEVFLYFAFVGRIHLQFHRFVGSQKPELIPGFCQLFFQLHGSHIVEWTVVIQTDKIKERITGSNRDFITAICLVFGTETVVSRCKIQSVVIAPCFIRAFANETLQFGKASQLGEPDIVDTRQGVKVHELIINFIFFFFRSRGNDTGNIARNRYCIEEL